MIGPLVRREQAARAGLCLLQGLSGELATFAAGSGAGMGRDAAKCSEEREAGRVCCGERVEAGDGTVQGGLGCRLGRQL